MTFAKPYRRITLSLAIALALPFLAANASKPQPDDSQMTLDTLRMIVFKGDFIEAKARLEGLKKSNQADKRTAFLLLDIEGELYYRMLDVDAAEIKWDSAFSIIQSQKNDSVYLALALSRKARIANYRIEKEKAYNYAKKSVEILNRHLNDLTQINAGEIYREYAYAHKIFLYQKNNIENYAIAERDIKKAISLSELSLGKGNYYVAALLHDLGNIWVDRSYKYKGIPSKIYWCDHNANLCYNKAISYYTRFFRTSDRIALSYIMKGLSLNMHHPADSLKSSFYYYNLALQQLISDFKPKQYTDNPKPDKSIKDIARVLQILHYKSVALINCYEIKKTSSLLQAAYEQSKTEVAWYELLLREYKSGKISLVMAVYDLTPYPNLSTLSLQLYENANDTAYLNDAFRYSELSNYFSLLTNHFKKTEFTNEAINKATALWQQVQQHIDSKTAFIKLLTNTHAVVITKSDFQLVKLNFNGVADMQKAFTTNDFDTYKRLAYHNYLNGFAPMLPHLKGVEKIIFNPTAESTLIPFEALLTDTSQLLNFSDAKSKFLIHRFAFQNVFSATLWLQEKGHKTHANLSVFSPAYTQKSNLPFNKELANLLSQQYQGTDYIHDATSNENFAQLMESSTNAWHITMHGDADFADAGKAKLFIDDDKSISLNEIVRLKIKTPLVVLAACKTSISRSYGGEGLINFPRAFKAVGAQAVIGALWSVDDKATATILEQFYKELEKGNSKTKALQLAKLHYLQSADAETANPLYWSGLNLYGNDAPLLLNKSKQPFWLWASGSIAFIAAGGFLFLLYRKRAYRTK